MEFENIQKGEFHRAMEVPIRVRYGETDQMGVVHHSDYFRYFEVARMEQFRSWDFSYRTLEDSGIYLMIMDAECKYRSSALFDEVILVNTEIIAGITLLQTLCPGCPVMYGSVSSVMGITSRSHQKNRCFSELIM